MHCNGYRRERPGRHRSVRGCLEALEVSVRRMQAPRCSPAIKPAPGECVALQDLTPILWLTAHKQIPLRRVYGAGIGTGSDGARTRERRRVQIRA